MAKLAVVFILYLINDFCSCGPLVNDNGNLTTYINQLEQRMQDVESKSQATEQKYAAVLSNILSKLTSQTDELMTVKKEQNSTAEELAEVKRELEALKNQTSHTTLYLQSKELIQGNTSELCSDPKGNCSIPRNATALRNQIVGFEASYSKNSIRNELRFANFTYNAGGGYNKTTGIFTVPVSGTYQIWFNVAFSFVTQKQHNVVTVKVVVNNNTVFTAARPAGNVNPQIAKNQLIQYGNVNGITIISGKKNDTFSFKIGGPSRQIKMPSSYGGMLIRSQTD